MRLAAHMVMVVVFVDVIQQPRRFPKAMDGRDCQLGSQSDYSQVYQGDCRDED